MNSPAHTNRAIELDGPVNARYLGGLRRTDGSVTPRGVFYRSENIDWMAAAGWEQMRTLGIRTVVDLRQSKRNAKGPRRGGVLLRESNYRTLTSSGMPGPNVVDTAPFWM
jgi:hypothetical protein